MKRFRKVIQSILIILAVVPFSLIWILVAATVSMLGHSSPGAGGDSHREVPTRDSTSIEIDDQRALVERPDQTYNYLDKQEKNLQMKRNLIGPRPDTQLKLLD